MFSGMLPFSTQMLFCSLFFFLIIFFGIWPWYYYFAHFCIKLIFLNFWNRIQKSFVNRFILVLFCFVLKQKQKQKHDSLISGISWLYFLSTLGTRQSFWSVVLILLNFESTLSNFSSMWLVVQESSGKLVLRGLECFSPLSPDGYIVVFLFSVLTDATLLLLSCSSLWDTGIADLGGVGALIPPTSIWRVVKIPHYLGLPSMWLCCCFNVWTEKLCCCLHHLPRVLSMHLILYRSRVWIFCGTTAVSH